MSVNSPPPPSPSHRIRSHSAPVNVVYFTDDNERLYTGDASGLVVITSTRSLRSLASWKAHTDGLLGVQEWAQAESIITHGRDNKLHVWKLVHESPVVLGGSAALPGLQTPVLSYSMDVNALNYCRFSFMPPPDTDGSSALIALPNLVESSLADVWTLPSRQRLHAAIGKTAWPVSSIADGREDSNGIIMAMHLFQVPYTSSSDRQELRLLLAYESGGVVMWRFSRTDKETSVEGVGWESVWSAKLHNETVMAMAISPDNSFALTVSADHIVGRYDMQAAEKPEVPIETSCVAHRTKHPGHGAIAIRDDGKVCAIGGWDGKIRLHSTKTLKSLGTLAFHKTACQALSFARFRTQEEPIEVGDAEDSEDEMPEEKRLERCRWLASGGKDHRIAIWPLMSFAKT